MINQAGRFMYILKSLYIEAINFKWLTLIAVSYPQNLLAL